VSGSVPLADRPEGQRLLATLQPGDTVITAKLDRAFRSAADALGTLEQLKEDKIGLHMIDLGGDVTGNGISKLVFTILSAVAENERDRIRERSARQSAIARRCDCSTAASGLSGSISSAIAPIFGWCQTPMSRPLWRVARHCATLERPIARSLMLG